MAKGKSARKFRKTAQQQDRESTPPDGEWTSWEVRHVRSSGTEDLGPILGVLDSGRGDPVPHTLQQMVLLEDGGFPPPQGRLRYEKADDDKPVIYRLKATPHCWRLYFWPDAALRRIYYLHTVCKHEQKSDPEDARKARCKLDELRDGSARVYPVRVSD